MDDLFEAAERCESLGLIEEAALGFERAAAAGERPADALMRRAILNSGRGDLRAAVSDFERSAAADPANPYPHMRLAQLYVGMGRRISMVEEMRVAAALEPGSVEMRVNLASAYLRAEWRDLAFATARTIPQEVGDWWAQARQDGLRWYRETRDHARDLLRRRRNESLDHNGLLRLAQLFQRLGRLRPARRICRALIADNAEWFLPFRVLADVEARAGGADAALAALAAYRLPPAPPPYVLGDLLEARTTFLNEAGRWDEVMAELHAYPDAERREPVRHTAAVAAFMSGQDAELKAHCLQWMRDYPLAVEAAGFVTLLHAREAARRPAAVEPRAAEVHLMQFWDKPEPPPDVADGMGEWLRLNPGWTRTLFDAPAARAFVAGRCGEDAARAFDLCYHPAMMADVFRIAFLQAAGGLYADADEVCVRPLDGFLPPLAQLELFAPRHGSLPGFVDTQVLGARQGSRILRSVLDEMTANLLQAAQEGRRPLIWEITGPGALTRGVARHLGEGPDGGEDVRLAPLQQVKAFVRTRDLAYKNDPKMNWRIAVG